MKENLGSYTFISLIQRQSNQNQTHAFKKKIKKIVNSYCANCVY